jgi:EAL domain-containing protein (putative c-di-GMP-specific phosphodiesterase class I)
MPPCTATVVISQELQPLGALAQTFAQRVEAALPVMYARWLSLHDASGQVHWQSGEVLGPDERDGVRAGLESFTGQAAPARVNYPLRSDRTAVLLRATDMLGEFSGFAMMVVENRRLRGKGVAARDLPVPVLRAVRDWGMTLARLANAVHVATDAGQATSPSLMDEPSSTEPAASEADIAELQTMPFSLNAQRLVPLQSGARIRRYEVFMRVEADVTGSTAPQALLQLAEKNHLGAVLDRRVLADLLAWLRERVAIWHTEPAQFSINVSAATLRDPGFPALVEQSLREARLPAGLIAFEIDEGLCRREPRRIESLAEVLARAGAGMVIDNFSLHDESVSQLMLPGLRLVKIDRALTGEVLHSKAGQARIAGLAHMARVAGVHSVAKKVDGEREHLLLADLGVDFVQGFAAAAPAPLEAIDCERRQLLLIDPLAEESPGEHPQALSA